MSGSRKSRSTGRGTTGFADARVALPLLTLSGRERRISGYVVVFDDVTVLNQAQRDAAWSEVARRLAHEVKNPLTPIRLAAERLQMKLADKLERPRQRIAGQGIRHHCCRRSKPCENWSMPLATMPRNRT